MNAHKCEEVCITLESYKFNHSGKLSDKIKINPETHFALSPPL